jgi:hypothetical protein
MRRLEKNRSIFLAQPREFACRIAIDLDTQTINPVGHSSRNQTPWLRALVTIQLRDRRILNQVPRRTKRSTGWFLCGLGGTALLAWNAPLVCATGAGMGTMLAVYTVKELGSWEAALAELQNTLKHLPPRVLISVLSGLGATVGTAGIFSLWQSSDNPAMAAGSIAQGLLTTGILGFLVWQQLRSPQSKALVAPASFDDWLTRLHSPDAIDRIQAIHQLHRQGERTTELLDYLRYLQDQDPDAQVRQVACTIAQQLQPAELTPSQQPLVQWPMAESTLFATNLHAIER